MRNASKGQSGPLGLARNEGKKGMTPMRTTPLTAAVVSVLGGLLLGCQDASKPVGPNEGLHALALCSVTTSRAIANPINVNAGTTNNPTSWLIVNNGSAITLQSETRSNTGKVIATHASNWVPYPHVLAAGGSIDADLVFDVGTAGTGTTGMVVHANCGNITLPTFSVTVH